MKLRPAVSQLTSTFRPPWLGGIGVPKSWPTFVCKVILLMTSSTSAEARVSAAARVSADSDGTAYCVLATPLCQGCRPCACRCPLNAADPAGAAVAVSFVGPARGWTGHDGGCRQGGTRQEHRDGGTEAPAGHGHLRSAAMAVAGYGALTVKCAVTDAAPEALTVTVAW